MFFVPQLIWTGCSLAYYSGLLVPIMSWQMHKENSTLDGKDKLANCLLAMCFFGIGQVIAGILMGLVIDKCGSRKACLLNVLALLLCIAI